MLVWYFRDIPVDFKYIAEPSMHSMPAVALHPNSKFFLTACIQSLSDYLNFCREGIGRVLSVSARCDGKERGCTTHTQSLLNR